MSTKKRETRPSLKDVKRIFSESAIDPRAGGVVAELMSDGKYLETKAFELLAEHRAVKDASLSLFEKRVDHLNRMKKIIGLLGLAAAVHEKTNDLTPSRRIKDA